MQERLLLQLADCDPDWCPLRRAELPVALALSRYDLAEVETTPEGERARITNDGLRLADLLNP